MAAAADFTYEGLTWSEAEASDRARDNRSRVQQRLLWLGVVLVVALGSVVLAGGSRHPTRLATGSSVSPIGELPLPLQATISRVAGAAAPEYAAGGTEAAAALHNTQHGLSARFTATGASIRALGESTKLRVRSYGYGGALRPVPAALPVHRANVVFYPRGVVTERYTNGPSESNRNSCSRAGHPCRLEKRSPLALGLSGTLTPRLSADSQGLAFHSGDRLAHSVLGLVRS